jgi:pimeloyl-ACP methyl ester carboxylesterase
MRFGDKTMKMTTNRAALARSAVLAAALVVGCGPRDESAKRETAVTPGKYADVNGLRMYYEIHGTGRPLVLLHGGLAYIESSFGKMLPSLAKNRQVIGIEQQGHGHTADIDRPLTYEQMAEDTAELLRRLGITAADFFGWSDGGIIATRIAMRHPELVRKFAIIGSIYNNDGLPPELRKAVANMSPDDVPAEFRAAYTKVAPKPEQWPTLVGKVIKLMDDSVWQGWRPEDIRSIRAPALVMIGDVDQVVRFDHVLQMFRLLPHAQLAVLPGTDHFAPLTRPDWILPMLEAFFDAPMPEPEKSEGGTKP